MKKKKFGFTCPIHGETDGCICRGARYWMERAKVAEAKADVCGGEWCAENRAEGRGPCGVCAWCCQQVTERAERAERQIELAHAELDARGTPRTWGPNLDYKPDVPARIARLRQPDPFLQQFFKYQASRDCVQEHRDYVASTAVRLKDVAGETVKEWPLAELLGFPENTYTVEWCGRYFRVNAIVPRGIVEGATHAFDNEIVASEVTEDDPLRDYEREQGAFKLPVEH